MRQQSPTVIVLAAGRSQRFVQSGGTTHKLDALLDGVPVLQRVLRTVAASGLPCYVVRPDVSSSTDTDGMGYSIARGVAATVDASGWLILPGDLPLVTARSLLQVAMELTSYPVVLPFWKEQQGHPVGFGTACREALMALGGDVGAASIVQTRRLAGEVQALHLDDPGIVTDIDTLDDLARAETLLAARQNQQDAVVWKA